MDYIYETVKSAFIVALSVVVILVLSRNGMFGSDDDIYTIDMNKVLKAHQSLVASAATDQFDAALNLKGASSKVSRAINDVAGGRLVLIAPVVASELANDITDEVILELGLDIPTSKTTFIDASIFPSPEEVQKNDPKEFYENYMEYLNNKSDIEAKKKAQKEIEAIIPK